MVAPMYLFVAPMYYVLEVQNTHDEYRKTQSKATQVITGRKTNDKKGTQKKQKGTEIEHLDRGRETKTPKRVRQIEENQFRPKNVPFSRAFLLECWEFEELMRQMLPVV